MFKCKICKKSVPKFSNKKYCSYDCRQEAIKIKKQNLKEKKPKRMCVKCNQNEAPSPWAIYCSDCRREVNKEQEEKRRIRSKIYREKKKQEKLNNQPDKKYRVPITTR